MSRDLWHACMCIGLCTWAETMHSTSMGNSVSYTRRLECSILTWYLGHLFKQNKHNFNLLGAILLPSSFANRTINDLVDVWPILARLCEGGEGGQIGIDLTLAAQCSDSRQILRCSRIQVPCDVLGNHRATSSTCTAAKANQVPRHLVCGLIALSKPAP